MNELMGLRLPESRARYTPAGMVFHCAIDVPGGGRRYHCQLTLLRDGRSPQMRVLSPDLHDLAGGRQLPHVYRNEGLGTSLCLWNPTAREWMPQMKLGETYIPWTVRWLTYFEHWLISNVWRGGGVHKNQVEDWRGACAEP